MATRREFEGEAEGAARLALAGTRHVALRLSGTEGEAEGTGDLAFNGNGSLALRFPLTLLFI